MSCKIEVIPRFQKDVKRLKKKFPNIKRDLIKFVNEVETNPTMGTSLGKNIFKVRVPNSSIKSGKSGGFRVITYYMKNDVLYLLTIYSKTEQDSILTQKLIEIVETEIK